MNTGLYVVHPGAMADAMALIADHGGLAAGEAAARAARSGTIGNRRQRHRWQQVERLLCVLFSFDRPNTLH